MPTNPKAVMLWLMLAGAATCSAFAYGPVFGMGAFCGLALGVIFFG